MIVNCKRPRRENTSTIKGIYVQFKSDLKSLVKAAVDGCGWLRRATYAVVYRKRGFIKAREEVSECGGL